MPEGPEGQLGLDCGLTLLNGIVVHLPELLFCNWEQPLHPLNEVLVLDVNRLPCQQLGVFARELPNPRLRPGTCSAGASILLLLLWPVPSSFQGKYESSVSFVDGIIVARPKPVRTERPSACFMSGKMSPPAGMLTITASHRD